MENPEKEGTYLCRLRNAFVCIAYYNADGKWIEMWGKKELDVLVYTKVPPELYPVAEKESEPRWDERDVLLNQLRHYLGNVQFASDRKTWDAKAIDMVNEYFDKGGTYLKSNFFGKKEEERIQVVKNRIRPCRDRVRCRQRHIKECERLGWGWCQLNRFCYTEED